MLTVVISRLCVILIVLFWIFQDFYCYFEESVFIEVIQLFKGLHIFVKSLSYAI